MSTPAAPAACAAISRALFDLGADDEWSASVMEAPEVLGVEAMGPDGTTVRVSSPDRVVFPATDRTPAATKLDVVRYYAAVGPGIFRALRLRPTTLERWPKGVRHRARW